MVQRVRNLCPLVTDSRYVKLEINADARQVQLPMYDTVIEKLEGGKSCVPTK
jgi:hypothetical protein